MTVNGITTYYSKFHRWTRYALISKPGFVDARSYQIVHDVWRLPYAVQDHKLIERCRGKIRLSEIFILSRFGNRRISYFGTKFLLFLLYIDTYYSVSPPHISGYIRWKRQHGRRVDRDILCEHVVNFDSFLANTLTQSIGIQGSSSTESLIWDTEISFQPVVFEEGPHFTTTIMCTVLVQEYCLHRIYAMPERVVH